MHAAVRLHSHTNLQILEVLGRVSDRPLYREDPLSGFYADGRLLSGPARQVTVEGREVGSEGWKRFHLPALRLCRNLTPAMLLTQLVTISKLLYPITSDYCDSCCILVIGSLSWFYGMPRVDV